ncbi:MAG: FGGY-family carbohydrate kinase [Candidatus Vecturithrix sp.]|jgi:xylulokinase|nr:FGGY-family carbohydrate kinase [Candidatus Vecturithrix sp.]
MQQIIAIDIGTTGAKTALISRAGEILARHYGTYETISHQGQVEQNPEDWWETVKQGILSLNSQINKEKFCGIVLGGQMQDCILLDETGLLAPAILYSDTRAQTEIQEIRQIIGEDRLTRITGNIQDASSLLAKFLWLKKHKREIYTRFKTSLFGAHDYIAWKLIGNTNTDFTTAATTGLLDIRQNRWAVDIIQELGLRTDILPHLVPGEMIDGYLSEKMAASLGLPANCPVFHGSGDVGTTTLGSNAGEPGTTSCYLGTSGWIAATTENVFANPDSGIFNLRHPDPGRTIQVGPMLFAGGNIQWIIEHISSFPREDNRYDLFNTKAADVIPGSDGVLYLPYLSGERSPFRAPEARGGFIGLSRGTTRSQMYRAALEGVAFAMRSIQESISGPDVPLKSLTLSGGGAKSSLWCQIFADLFHCEVCVLEHAEEVGLIGAALMCGKALGWYSGYRLPEALLNVKTTYAPKVENIPPYNELYAIFRHLYPALRKSWSALSVYREKRY